MFSNNGHDDMNELRAQARQRELNERAQNEILEQKLNALDRGEPLESIVEEEGVFQEARDLADTGPITEPAEIDELVKLAAALRGVTLPFLGVEQAQAQEQRVQEAARSGVAGREAPTRPLPQAQRQSARPQAGAGLWSFLKRQPVYYRFAFAGLALLLVVGIALTGAGIYLAGPRGAQAATLMDANGQVERLSSEGSWQALRDGDRVQSGQRLRTGPASHATLVFFDGTRATLDPGTDATLNAVGGDWGNVLRVSLSQNAGLAHYSVVPLKGSKSAFTVLTPSGAASVHGTTFDVSVDPRGKSRFGVTTGRVLVSNDSSQTLITSGQATLAEPGGVVEEASYQFSLQGLLTANKGTVWVVAGVPFTVAPDTDIVGSPQVGAQVVVTGRVLASGEWVADSVELATPDQGEKEPVSSFTGTIESMEGDSWKIDGWTVLVDNSTELGDGLKVGQTVQVTFQPLSDGQWHALKIIALAEPAVTPTQEVTAPATESQPMPVLDFQPGELTAQACGESEVSVSGKLVNTATEAGDVAANVELAAQVVEGAGFVKWIELIPSTWDQVGPGESVNFTVHMALNWASAASDDQEVTLRVVVMNESNNPAGQDTRLTVKVENECEETEEPEGTETVPATQPVETVVPGGVITPTVEVTLPVTVTETITPTITVTPEITTTVAAPLTNTDCTGANPHPEGERLAAKYAFMGVTYDQIMGWFCQGFGFGEIDLAYALSWQTGKPVEEIFAMKSGGMGWGEIKKQLQTGVGNPKHSVPHGPYGLNTQEPAVASTPEPPGNSGHPNKPGKPPKGP